jgi:hypothetical protein
MVISFVMQVKFRPLSRSKQGLFLVNLYNIMCSAIQDRIYFFCVQGKFRPLSQSKQGP